MLHELNHELAVLSKAVAYQNLTGAANQLGISQPQLSRIIGKLEHEYAVVLLDRSSPRNTSWTPAAHRLAEIYKQTCLQFKVDIDRLNNNSTFHHLRIGALEGLIPYALRFVDRLFKKTGMKVITLDTQDLNLLEEFYGKNSYDLLISCRVPGRKKAKFHLNIGYQKIEAHGKTSGIEVLSSYEYASKHPDETHPILVSNSLDIRNQWIRDFSGYGRLPTKIKAVQNPEETDVPVMIVAHDLFPENLWKNLIALVPTA